jgi:cytochrome c
MKSLILSASALLLAAALPVQASEDLAKKWGCTACHVVKGTKTIGPAYADVAKKYAGQKDAEAKLFDRVKKGVSPGSTVWGQTMMPANAHVPDADVKALVKWVLSVK